MKIKGIRLAAILGMSMIALTGCSGQSSSGNQNNVASSQNSNQNDSPMWNVRKNDSLEEFVEDWQSSMNQVYKKYDGKNALKTSAGTSYPDDLSQVKVEGKTKSAGWSKHGNGNYKYNVVAIYNYEGQDGHITYLFTFHNGKPVVLVDQSNSSDPDFKMTENTKLKSNFAQIAHGKDYTSNNSDDDVDTSSQKSDVKSSSQNNSASVANNPRILAIIVYQEAMPGYDPAKDEMGMYFGQSDGKYGTGGGTGESGVQFKAEGNNVHYWKLDPDSADVVADETMKEYTVSLDSLVSKYYSTPEQKQVVQAAADKLHS